MLKSKTICHQGLVREHNEDSYVSNQSESIWLVADGVGGSVGGEIASQLAVQTVDRCLRQGKSLVESINFANEAILSAVVKQPELQGMATTIMAAQFKGNDFELSWVGDSRAYVINASAIKQLSSDHNVANELFLQGDISKEEAIHHKGQHELTQALGQLSLSDIPVIKGTLAAGSGLLICSDGLSGVITDNEILDTFCSASSLDNVAESLLAQVLEAGAPDNITFTIISNELPESKSIQNLDDSESKNKHLNIANKAPFTWGALLLVALVMVIMFYVD